MADALSGNAIMNFIALVSSYKTELDNKFEYRVKMDKNYQNLKEKVIENESKNIKIDFILNEKGLMLYENKLYVPNVP